MITRTITLAAGLALGACAHAQDAARADAPVPPTAYASALAGYNAAPAMAGTPAANWAAANAAVAGGAHAMQPQPTAHDAHAGHEMPMKPAQRAPRDAHAGHDKPAAADPHAAHRQPDSKPAQSKEHQHEH